MFDRCHEDEDEEIIHEPVYLCFDCGEESPHSELIYNHEHCPFCDSDDLEEL